MTLLEFVKKYNGTKVDFDKAYGAQCVDLFRQYNQDVFGLPHTGVVVGACDLVGNYDKLSVEKQYYDLIKAPSDWERGDVIVWNGTSSNQYGHVAILLAKEGDNVLVFEQDGYKQDGAKLSIKTITNFAGYLRRK